MSKKAFFRTRSFRRKSIKPVIDIDEDEDQKRRDIFGRKRVDVIQCLLESSSDASDNESNIINRNSHPILWLTFAEICHIRTVLAQTMLSTLMSTNDKQYLKIVHGDVCFRCRQSTHSFLFLSSLFSSTNSFICYICQQNFCRKCSISNFLPPLLKHCFSVRLQALIKTTSTVIDNGMNNENEVNQQRKAICFDCSQIFNEHRKSSQYSVESPSTKRLHSFSSNSNTSQYVQNSHSSIHTCTDTSFSTRF